MTTDSPACSPVHLSTSCAATPTNMEMRNGWTAKNQLGDDEQKLFQTLRFVLRQLRLHRSIESVPQQRASNTLPVSLNRQKNRSCPAKKKKLPHNNTERECCARYTAKVPTLHSLCYALLLLADCQSKMPLPSCSYRQLAAPNETFLVIMSFLIWNWRQQSSEVKHFSWIQEVIYPTLSCIEQPLGGCRKQFIQCFQ